MHLKVPGEELKIMVTPTEPVYSAFCVKCGLSRSGDWKVCPKCGTAFPAAAAEAVPSRLRLLVEGGETEGGAEVDLAQLLREQGDMEAATSILKEALARYFPAAVKGAPVAAALAAGAAHTAPPTARERSLLTL